MGLSDAVPSALERRLSCISHAESTSYVQINTEQLSQREHTGSEPRWAPLELLEGPGRDVSLQHKRSAGKSASPFPPALTACAPLSRDRD